MVKDIVKAVGSNIYLIVFLLLSVVSISYLDKQTCMNLLTMIQRLDAINAFFLFSFIYIFSNLFFIPIGLPLNLLAGVLWGTIGGGLIVNILATFVAGIAFLLARSFKNRFQEEFIIKYPSINRLKNIINCYDWQFIAMARINPIIPFSISNYAFGLIPELSFKHYIVATMLANMLPCLVFASLGAALKTFVLEDKDIYSIIFEFGIVLLLISALLIMKMMAANQSTPPLNKEVS